MISHASSLNLEELMLKIWFSISCIVLLGIVGCTDSKNTMGIVPNLKFQQTTIIPSGLGYDSMVWVDVQFEDGDGDIGLGLSDTLGDFAYGQYDFHNLKVYYLYMENGQWVYPMNPLSATDTITFHERLPVLTPTGKNKAISSDLRLKIPVKPYGFSGDSIKYRLRISDRLKHRSDWVESPLVVVKPQ